MIKSITVLAISLFLFSCGNTSNEKSKEQTETVTHEEQQHNYEIPTIKLNNGEKWMVNEEMKPFILESENILNDYINSNSSDYKSLAEQLKEKNSELIKSCTMKGKSHDELHKWLHPHMDLIKALAQGNNTKNAESIVSELAISFETYYEYFQ